MKYTISVLLLLMVSAVLTAQVKTCYDIQYTTDPSGNSPYMNQTVTVQGIVTGVRYYTGSTASNFGFYISDPEGGPWRGLLVYTNQHSPQLGDMVLLTGNVAEYYNLTELTSVSSYQVLSQGNPIPEPQLINSGDLSFPATGEQWESVLVKVQNVTVTTAPNNYGEFKINDGSGNCQVDNQFFDIGHSWGNTVALNQVWAEMRGIVDFSFSEYGLNPRNTNDMIREYTLANAAVWFQSITAGYEQINTIALKTSRLRASYNIESYSTKIRFNPNQVKFEGVDISSTLTLSDAVQVTLSPTEDWVQITYLAYASGDYDGPVTSDVEGADLIKLKFRPVEYGSSSISFDEFYYNDVLIQSANSGSIITPIRKKMAYLNISNPNNTKNIFNPALNEKITIKYGYEMKSTGINARATLRIYDVQGRLVNTLVNKNISSANGIESYIWNGRDTSMNLLPIGVYYCHLEVVERDSGNREKTVQPIVIGSKLK